MPENPGTIRVLCVDDNRAVLDAVSALIGHTKGLECAGSLTSSRGLRQQVAAQRARVVVLDLTIPGDEPLEDLRELCGSMVDVKAIAFSGYDDEMTRALALEAGAVECISKNDPMALIAAIRRAGESGKTPT